MTAIVKIKLMEQGDCQYLPNFGRFTLTCLIHANDKTRV